MNEMKKFFERVKNVFMIVQRRSSDEVCAGSLTEFSMILCGGVFVCRFARAKRYMMGVWRAFL